MSSPHTHKAVYILTFVCLTGVLPPPTHTQSSLYLNFCVSNRCSHPHPYPRPTQSSLHLHFCVSNRCSLHTKQSTSPPPPPPRAPHKVSPRTGALHVTGALQVLSKCLAAMSLAGSHLVLQRTEWPARKPASLMKRTHKEFHARTTCR